MEQPWWSMPEFQAWSSAAIALLTLIVVRTLHAMLFPALVQLTPQAVTRWWDEMSNCDFYPDYRRRH